MEYVFYAPIRRNHDVCLPDPRRLQARALRTRFGVQDAFARVLAEHVFGTDADGGAQ